MGLRARSPCIFDHSSEKLRDRENRELRYCFQGALSMLYIGYNSIVVDVVDVDAVGDVEVLSAFGVPIAFSSICRTRVRVRIR